MQLVEEKKVPIESTFGLFKNPKIEASIFSKDDLG